MGRRRYPLDTPALPFRCPEPNCECNRGSWDGVRTIVDLRPSQGGWQALVMDEDGKIIDAFNGPTTGEALGSVHREFPWAVFDPEPED